jgi:hypothetical protein
MNVRKVLAKWDAGETIQSIEMGGLGDGYEQCIQLCIFEIIRDWFDGPRPDLLKLLPPRKGGYPKMDTAQSLAWERYKQISEAAIHRANRTLDLGLSGAQAGAATNAAFNFLTSADWESALAQAPPNRIINVRHSRSPKLTPTEAFNQGRNAAKEWKRRKEGDAERQWHHRRPAKLS